ncbi:MAG: hypothetical protein AB7O53_09605 [Thermoleophilia bacterium]
MRRAAVPAALAALAAVAVAAPSPGAATADTRAAARAAARRAAGACGTPRAPGGQQGVALVALRAAGRSHASLRPRLRVLSRVAPGYATTAGGAAKVALAAIAAGTDPRRVGGVDYLKRVTSRYAAGRYGATAYDQAYSILAVVGARRAVPLNAIRATLRARGRGGWDYAMSGARDSVDATAVVIEALRAAGLPAANPGLRAAAAWMTAQRNAEGGYATAGGGRPTDANSTAGAIRALRALGRAPAPATRAALRRLQQGDGSVRATRATAGSPLIATNDALVAFAGGRLPER